MGEPVLLPEGDGRSAVILDGIRIGWVGEDGPYWRFVYAWSLASFTEANRDIAVAELVKDWRYEIDARRGALLPASIARVLDELAVLQLPEGWTATCTANVDVLVYDGNEGEHFIEYQHAARPDARWRPVVDGTREYHETLQAAVDALVEASRVAGDQL